MEVQVTTYDTRNDLNSNAKKASIELLNARLVDAVDLSLIARASPLERQGSTIYRHS